MHFVGQRAEVIQVGMLFSQQLVFFLFDVVQSPSVVKAGLLLACFRRLLRAEGMVEAFLFVPRRVSGNQIGDARIQPAQYRQVIANEDGLILAVHLRRIVRSGLFNRFVIHDALPSPPLVIWSSLHPILP